MVWWWRCEIALQGAQLPGGVCAVGGLRTGGVMIEGLTFRIPNPLEKYEYWITTESNP